MKKVLKVITKVIKWITILPQILDIVEQFANSQKIETQSSQQESSKK